ncbi:MAG: hypothetical protein EAZ91_07925 [Cytophagales bacterium]|nr:MAG: hypothetical protein EAZ91_07925 [Cytophagales bacterium]
MTTDQLAAIDRHLRKDNWLQNEALIAELTDHYANTVEAAMVQSISFELALLDAHKAFGGRKGLLNMEEEYWKMQAKNTSRQRWERFKTYFNRPRIYWTIGAFVVINFLLITWNRAGQPEWFSSEWSIVGLCGLAMCSFTVLFITLRQPDFFIKAVQPGLMPEVFLGQGAMSLISLLFFVQMLIPVKTVVLNCSPPVALLLTLALVFEAASMEVLTQKPRFDNRQTA